MCRGNCRRQYARERADRTDSPSCQARWEFARPGPRKARSHNERRQHRRQLAAFSAAIRRALSCLRSAAVRRAFSDLRDQLISSSAHGGLRLLHQHVARSQSNPPIPHRPRCVCPCIRSCEFSDGLAGPIATLNRPAEGVMSQSAQPRPKSKMWDDCKLLMKCENWSSGWIRTSNPPVNRLTQVVYLVGSSPGLALMEILLLPGVREEIVHGLFTVRCRGQVRLHRNACMEIAPPSPILARTEFLRSTAGVWTVALTARMLTASLTANA
jgi:hypothetical protein